jgi:hypothetical protein
MKCVRCSAEIPAQSQFCLRCGAPIQATSANPTGVMASPLVAPRPNTRPLLITIALLALAVVALGVVSGGLLMRGGRSESGQLVQSPGQTGSGALVQAPGAANSSPLVQAPADTPSNQVVQQPGETAPYPADIDDYLKFLKQIEASKQQLIRKELGDALTLLPQAKALGATIDENQYNETFGNINKNMNYNADEWNQLTATFNQRTPPESCRDLHNKYYDQLGKIQGAIVAINDALSKVQNDPSGALHALSEMQGKASAEADAAIRAADDALGDVCSRYHLKKEFDIKDDGGSASMFR